MYELSGLAGAFLSHVPCACFEGTMAGRRRPLDAVLVSPGIMLPPGNVEHDTYPIFIYVNNRVFQVNHR